MRDDFFYSEKIQGDDIFELEAAMRIKLFELEREGDQLTK